MDQVTVLAPATVSNVVCGFDCLGFALGDPVDEITVGKTGGREIAITNLDDYNLPTDPERNVAGVALRASRSALAAAETARAFVAASIGALMLGP